MPGFEPGMSPPQGEVLTTILHAPGEAGYRSQYLSHAKRALYHLSYIPIQSAMTSNTHKIAHYAAHTNQHDPQTRMHATRIPHHPAANFHALTITSRTKTEQVAHNDTTLINTTPSGIKARRTHSLLVISSRGLDEYHLPSQCVRYPGRSSVVAVLVRHHPHLPQTARATGVDTSSTTGYCLSVRPAGSVVV